jgi:hypothetical protein
LLLRLQSLIAARIVVPPDALELAHGGDPRHDGQIAVAADLRACRSAGVANDPDMRGLDEK